MGALKKNAGYDQEEAYFHKLNQELIQKTKARGHLQLVKGAGNTPLDEEPKPAKKPGK